MRLNLAGGIESKIKRIGEVVLIFQVNINLQLYQERVQLLNDVIYTCISL